MAVSETNTLLVNKVTVTTAGTRVQFPSHGNPVRGIVVVPWKSNTGAIYIGGSDVDSNTHDGLYRGDTFNHRPGIWFELDEFYADSSQDGEGFDLYVMKY